jgi:hypothetical protein
VAGVTHRDGRRRRTEASGVARGERERGRLIDLGERGRAGVARYFFITYLPSVSSLPTEVNIIFVGWLWPMEII